MSRWEILCDVLCLAILPGAAIARVKIDGILHEFSSIPNVKEDVIEFLLNVKAIRIKSLTNLPGKMILDVSGEGRVTAADIKPSADFEIVNPELYLATLGFSLMPDSMSNSMLSWESGFNKQNRQMDYRSEQSRSTQYSRRHER